ncbi:Serine/threonine-protein kinase AFC2 [Sesamum angolense]|uniref:Serine/threonine-protein kinase AFC2 n=1 Tax=Sesamum angolense TaxID=2727404 RepID=A0AAE1X0A2_9LAMI|nr:Serine/threonine-protein kinase AFC2 [Sesamum angolense]
MLFMETEFTGSKPLPINLAFPQSLKKLTLSGCRISLEKMTTVVGSLHNLEILKLKNYACEGSVWEPNEGEFTKLKFLLIESAPLEHWRANSTHFPQLRFLSLHYCLRLAGIPSEIGDIETLELLEVHQCSQSVVASAMLIQEEQQNLGNHGLGVSIYSFDDYSGNHKNRSLKQLFLPILVAFTIVASPPVVFCSISISRKPPLGKVALNRFTCLPPTFSCNSQVGEDEVRWRWTRDRADDGSAAEEKAALGWDVLPQAPKAQLGLFSGQEIGNVTSYAPSRALSDHPSSLFVKGLARNDKIHSKMGEGTFGQVLECWDRERKEMVAVKIVRVMHDLHLIHTDLKPENILLVSSEYLKVPDYKVSAKSPKDSSYYKRIPKSSAIKVIDFGSTTYDRQDQSYIVSTRHYRAPEVILGLGWSYPCDIWSVGCILVELCSGEALFQTHENLEHLAMMEKVLGPLPQHMLKKADRHAEKYVRRGRLDWPEEQHLETALKLY